MTNIENGYFRWMCKLVRGKDYTKLLKALHSKKYYWLIDMDSNRVYDGYELRKRFIFENRVEASIDELFDYDCTVLEMMIGLASRCEDEIMHQEELGDRTPIWFWSMIENLHLNDMTNEFFNKNVVDSTIDTMLRREYAPNGDGGLFKVYRHNCDMRQVELWYQMNYYLVEAYPI